MGKEEGRGEGWGKFGISGWERDAAIPGFGGDATTPLGKRGEHVDKALKVWFLGRGGTICSKKTKRKGAAAPFWSKEGDLNSLACCEKRRIGGPFWSMRIGSRAIEGKGDWLRSERDQLGEKIDVGHTRKALGSITALGSRTIKGDRKWGRIFLYTVHTSRFLKEHSLSITYFHRQPNNNIFFSSTKGKFWTH